MFITFEGGEGAGKSTLIAKLQEELEKRGKNVVITREPGGSKLGEHIRSWLLDPQFEFTFCPKAELLLFLASRAQHIEEVIQPALKNGKIVFCDRFNDSTVAYQGGGRGLGLDYVQQLCDLVCKNVVPDLTFFLDIDPSLGQARIQNQRAQDAKARPNDRMEAEKLTFHHKVREAFRYLAEHNRKRIHVLDGSKSKDEIVEAALQVIDSTL